MIKIKTMFLVRNQREYIILNFDGYIHSKKLSGYRIGITFDKNPLAVEQNNSLSKMANVYIATSQMLGQEILLKIPNLKIAYLEQLAQ